jgi:hypothetical protein
MIHHTSKDGKRLFVPKNKWPGYKVLVNFTVSETYLLAKFADWLEKIPECQNTYAVSHNT